MATDTDPSPPSLPAKRQHDEHAEPSSPKRVKVDTEPPAEARPPSTKGGTQQKDKKAHKRRDAAGYSKSRQGKEKDMKNVGRRRGSRPEASADASTDTPADAADKAPRLPKRQCAVLIGFCGTGCAGMQIQPDVRTIEGVLFDAFVRAGAVSADNADDPTKVGLGRAARTDAGVHAAGNVVSLKLITQIPGVPDVVAAVNELLPPEIRVWSITRVQNSFNARTSCDSRKYTYFFPSYLLIPPKPGSGLYETFRRQAVPSSSSSITTSTDTVHPFWEEASPGSSKEDDLRRKRRWRVGPEAVERLRETAKKFEATRNYHNFTVGREFSDRSAQRHMKKIEVADPAVYGDTEWISVLFHGQSFMLHQIRKMVAALVLCCRTGAPPQTIDELYGPRPIFIPKMPSLGLLLEHPIFDSYNRRVDGANANTRLAPADADFRPPIDFAPHADAIGAFKEAQIYARMRDIEDRGGVFDAWIRSVDAYAGDDLLYLNPKGIVPAAAVLKKGERRKNPFREKRRFDTTDFAAAGRIEVEADAEDAEEEEVEGVAAMDKAALADMEG